MERALTALRAEFDQSGKRDLFERLKEFVWGGKNALPHAVRAEQLEMSEGAVRVAVHRLRQRYGELLRAEVAHTVSTPVEMDLVEDRNLAQVVRDEPSPSRKAATYLKTIAEALEYAHSRGVLHRELKPSNILIDEHDQPRITDFGLAKRLPSDSQLSTSDAQLPQTGQVLGSG